LQVFKTSFDRFKSQTKKNQKGASPWKVTQWAIHDEAKLRGIIDRLWEYVDGLESITISLGLWSDQQVRLNDEIENISDVESLKLLRDANSGKLVSAQPDISDKASRRLISVAESIFEQKVLDSGSMVNKEDDSFVTAYSNPSGLRPTIDLLMPGSWPKSISSAILGPRLASSTRPDDDDTPQTTRFETSCSECLKANHDCERLPNSERCLLCDHSNIVRELAYINETSLTGQYADWQMPQNQRWVAEIMRKSKPHIPQSFERGETDYGKRLSAIKAEDEEHCQNTSIKLIAQAEVGSSSAKRMFLELRNIRTGKVPFVSAAPVGDSLDKVLASIEGPLETPYEGGVFWIATRISQKDSLAPPLMKFQTRVYHPNISPQGHICADFGDKWNTFHAAERYNTSVTSMWYRGKSPTPHWTLGALLTAICGLLACPDVGDPLVPEIAQICLEDYDTYCENARVYTKRYATGERPDEASLSFLEEEGEPIQSEKLPMEPDEAIISQSGRVNPQDDDARSVRDIREYDDRHPDAFCVPIRKALQRDTSPARYKNNDQDEVYDIYELSDDSAQTYGSSMDDEYYAEDLDYEVPEYRESATGREPRASGPDNFSKLFPSQRRIFIRHDDTVYDGNMNLRIDTEVQEGGETVSFILFHVQMHDLKSREFSIRRYEKSSGRVVCRTSRRYKKTVNTSEGRQGDASALISRALKLTFSDALATYSSSHRKTSSVGSIRSRTSASSLKSVSKDPGSNNEEDDIFVDDHETISKRSKAPIPTNTIKMEFNNLLSS
jgi:ubiquitin-protein ligase